MTCRIITYVMAGLAMLHNACLNSEGIKENDLRLQSAWQLDEKTHQAIVHHCVETNFTDNPATFSLKRKGDDLLLQFNGQHHVWIAPANRKFFYAWQVMKSSSSGRFCGFQTEIRISFRLPDSNQSTIKGIWQATSCDYCPKIEFIAHRIN